MNLLYFALGKPLLALLGAASFTFAIKTVEMQPPPEVLAPQLEAIPREAPRPPAVEELEPRPAAPVPREEDE